MGIVGLNRSLNFHTMTRVSHRALSSQPGIQGIAATIAQEETVPRVPEEGPGFRIPARHTTSPSRSLCVPGIPEQPRVATATRSLWIRCLERGNGLSRPELLIKTERMTHTHALTQRRRREVPALI